MKLKLTVILTTLVVTLGLLLGASAASWAQPGPATLISPSGTITDNIPTYTWNAVTDSTWYYLWVNDSTQEQKILQWYGADRAGCGDGTGECSVTPATVLADGAAVWWIRTWNIDGLGDWSAGMSFMVDTSAPPEPATQISPSGTITDNTPTYTWNAVANSAQYRLFVWESIEKEIIDQWYTAAEAGCTDDRRQCTVTPETVLAEGSYEWWIRTKNDNGKGDWSAGMSFTVDESMIIPPAPVPKTGQTESFEEGDDGDLQKGVPWPNPRFTDNADGTVTDNLTRLIWLKDANCIIFFNSDFTYKYWSESLELSNNLAEGECGLTDGSVAGDWHMPNVRELHSLIDYSNFNPTLPTGHPFSNVTDRYYTSTTLAQDDEFVNQVDMQFGSVTSTMKLDAIAVWPVRGGN